MTEQQDELQRIEGKLLDVLNEFCRYRIRAASGCPTEPTPTAAFARRRNYVAGSQPPDWRHVVDVAALFKVHRTTAWDWAEDCQARWPYGKAQRVDFSKMKHRLP